MVGSRSICHIGQGSENEIGEGPCIRSHAVRIQKGGAACTPAVEVRFRPARRRPLVPRMEKDSSERRVQLFIEMTAAVRRLHHVEIQEKDEIGMDVEAPFGDADLVDDRTEIQPMVPRGPRRQRVANAFGPHRPPGGKRHDAIERSARTQKQALGDSRRWRALPQTAASKKLKIPYMFGAALPQPLADTRFVLRDQNDAVTELQRTGAVEACVQIQMPVTRDLIDEKDRGSIRGHSELSYGPSKSNWSLRYRVSRATFSDCSVGTYEHRGERTSALPTLPTRCT